MLMCSTSPNYYLRVPAGGLFTIIHPQQVIASRRPSDLGCLTLGLLLLNLLEAPQLSLETVSIDGDRTLHHIL
mgnify:CR=1 FL=1